MQKLAADILEHCLVPYDGFLASGYPANNKLEMDKLDEEPELRYQLADAMAERVAEYEPDLIMSTPRGADWYARYIAKQLGVACMTLLKDDTTKRFSFHPVEEQLIADYDYIVIVDDVLNQLTNTMKVLRLPGVRERTEAIVGGWDRWPLRRHRPKGIAVDAAIRHPIPNVIPQNSELWTP